MPTFPLLFLLTNPLFVDEPPYILYTTFETLKDPVVDDDDNGKVSSSQQSSNSHRDSETWELPGRSPPPSPVHSTDSKGSPPYSSDEEEDRVGWVLHLELYHDLSCYSVSKTVCRITPAAKLE